MKRNNIKLLTYSEQSKLNDKFSFECDGENVIVINNHYNRKTSHSINDTFSINSKIRKVSFTPDAMKYWIELKNKYSLIDVQQAVNKLFVLYQDITLDKVKIMLNKESTLVRKI